MPAYQHKYISGAQHVDEGMNPNLSTLAHLVVVVVCCFTLPGVFGVGVSVSAGKGERYFAAAHETAAFVLQNAAGARQWPVEKSFSNALVQAFKQTRV